MDENTWTKHNGKLYHIAKIKDTIYINGIKLHSKEWIKRLYFIGLLKYAKNKKWR